MAIVLSVCERHRCIPTVVCHVSLSVRWWQDKGSGAPWGAGACGCRASPRALVQGVECVGAVLSVPTARPHAGRAVGGTGASCPPPLLLSPPSAPVWAPCNPPPPTPDWRPSVGERGPQQQQQQEEVGEGPHPAAPCSPARRAGGWGSSGAPEAPRASEHPAVGARRCPPPRSPWSCQWLVFPFLRGFTGLLLKTRSRSLSRG